VATASSPSRIWPCASSSPSYKLTAPHRPKIRTTDRLFWAGLARVWTGWRQALIIVSPDTVLRWQRRRFREYWTRLSRRPTGGRPGSDTEIAALIRKMATTNPLWGAPRIHGELLKLGIEVAERTVSRLMPKSRSRPSQTWRTFLANHVLDLVSIDFFTVPTAPLRVLFVLVVLAHYRGASSTSTSPSTPPPPGPLSSSSMPSLTSPRRPTSSATAITSTVCSFGIA
jgi:hypothetical protein